MQAVWLLPMKRHSLQMRAGNMLAALFIKIKIKDRRGFMRLFFLSRRTVSTSPWEFRACVNCKDYCVMTNIITLQLLV